MSSSPLECWSPVAGMRATWCLDYDSNRYPFAHFLRTTVFAVENLAQLHQSHWIRPGSPVGYDDNLRLRERMQRLPLHSTFYTIYERFVRELVVHHFGGRLSYSQRPKMRVHLAGSGSVSRWHRDAEVTGRLEQINLWLPLTHCFGGNTLWLEDDYGSAHYQPIAVRHGQALFFDGGLLAHGTVANHTESSRVSFDLRFAPSSARPSAMTTQLLGQHPPPSVIADLCPSLGAGRA
jgi:hypothetical protein